MTCSQSKNNQAFDFHFVNDLSALDAALPKAKSLFNEAPFIASFQEVFTHIHHQIVQIKQGNELIAQLYFQCMPFKGKELSAYIPQESRCFLSKTVEALVDLALERIHWKLAVLGNVFITGDDGQHWYKPVAAEQKWVLIHEAIARYTKQQEVDAVIIGDLNEKQLVGSAYLKNNKYRRFEVEPDLKLYLDSNWKNFSDYLQSLSSKYRVRAKKVFKKSKEINIRELTLAQILDLEPQLLTLYENVVNEADFKLAEVPSNYFSKMKQLAEDKFVVHGFFFNDQLVAFVCYFKNYTCLNINFVGLNYAFNRSHSLYQRILYHCIEEGILQAKEMVHFGRTATEIKTAVGAEPFKSYSFIKHNNKIPNIAIKPLTTYLKPEPFVQRNPFKELVH